MTRLSLAALAVAAALVPSGLAGPACVQRKWASVDDCTAACGTRWGFPGKAMGQDPWGAVMKPASTDMSSMIAKACGATSTSTTQSSATASASAIKNVASTSAPAKLTLAPETTTSTSATPSSTSTSTSTSTTSTSTTSTTSKTTSTSSKASSVSFTINQAIETSEATSSTSQLPKTTFSAPKPKPTTSVAPKPTQPTTTAAPQTTAAAPKTTAAAQTTAASSGSSSSSGGSVSSADQQSYLDAHNTVRAQHGASALTWSDELEAAAQKWANNCVFQHSGGTLGPFGENLAAGTGDGYTIASAVKSWTDEVSEYSSSNPVPSHFTQVVWKASTQVGCAVAQCDGIFAASFGKAHFHVCEYKVQGNVIGQFGQQVQA